MENSLKQRIIGAVVLAALAIIFLPTILKEKNDNGTFESRIPAKPKVLDEYRIDKQKIEKLVSEKDQLVIKRDETSQANESTMPLNQEITETTQKEQVKVDEKSNSRKSKAQTADTSNRTAKTTEKIKEQTQDRQQLEKEQEKIGSQFESAAWVVQVASFTSETNASNLVSKLKQNNFKAYRRKSAADGKTVHRVFVGPFLNKPEAQSATQSISKVSETEVALRPFDPVKH